MAKRAVITTIDDIDGSEGAEPVEFGLDGVTYAIDLSVSSSDALRKTLAPYVDHAQKVGRRPGRRRRPASGA